MNLPDANSVAIEDLAAFFAENMDELSAVDGWMFRAKRRLAEAIRDQGPLRTDTGTLALATDKWKWDEESLLAEFPAMGSHLVELKCDTQEQAEQAISYALESGWNPDEVAHRLKPDLRLVNQAIKTIAPEKAARLLGLRTPAGKLELK